MGSYQPVESALAPFAQRPIIILGAGIIGCAAARQLLLAGFQVTLVAEYLPGDQSILYASAWAGAAWHAASGITPDQRYLQAVTYRHLLKMAREEPESGVCIVKGLEYLEQPPDKSSSIWGKTVLRNFRDLKQGEYPSNFSCGWSYETLVTNPTLHIPYLKKKITELGGQFVQQRIESLQELYDMFPEAQIFINASGWGSKLLSDVRDDKCFPERGQNVFFKTDDCNTMYFRNGNEYTYVIPRPQSHGVILGGVKQADNLYVNHRHSQYNIPDAEPEQFPRNRYGYCPR